jgi:hypothetical protein
MVNEIEEEDDIEVVGSETEVMAKVTFRNAILLQCHQCMGFYQEGKIDCEVTNCSLYSFMPYAKKEPNLEVFKLNPRKRGKVKLMPPNPEKAEAARERFKKARDNE